MSNRVLRFIMPAFWGLMMIVGIRIVTDFQTGMKFWERELSVNFVEILGCIIYGYVSDIAIRWSLSVFKKKGIGKAGQIIISFGMLTLSVFPLVKVVHLFAGLDDRLQDYMIAWFIVLVCYWLQYEGIAGEISEREIREQQLQLEEIKSQQLDTELRLLKSQYQPHFLFNVLNTIYFQIDENNQAPRQTIEKLSSLLRYQLYQMDKMVTLDNELVFSRDYVDLMKMRKSESLEVSVDLEPRDGSQQIYPMLLQPLIENAFKYVGGDNYIDIRLMEMTPHNLEFEVVNSIPTQGVEIGNNDSCKGIGLENLRRRLEILYPGNYELETIVKKGKFMAKLKINTAWHQLNV